MGQNLVHYQLHTKQLNSQLLFLPKVAEQRALPTIPLRGRQERTLSKISVIYTVQSRDTKGTHPSIRNRQHQGKTARRE